MTSNTGLDFILIFAGSGLAFIVVTLLVSRWISPKNPNAEKNAIYESGEESIGNYWPRVSNGYFIIALLFVLFEIEVVLLFPIAAVFGKSKDIEQAILFWGAILGFLAILIVGLAYAWVNGHLDWMKPKPEKHHFKGQVPTQRYEEFNKKYDR